MKNNTIYSACILLYALIFVSCNKNDVAPVDDFTVTTASTTYKVGDSVIFNLTGSPNQIVFFSGEIGKNYAFANRSVAAGVPKLVFQTNMTQGVLLNNDSLRLYVSTNLKGYDSVSVVAATWTDITTRNTKWPTTLSTTFVTSDSIALDDFNSADSINIAFRAIGKKYATAAQRKWQIQNLTLTNFLNDGNSNALFSTFANTGFVQANLKNNPLPTSGTNYQAWNVGQAGVNASNGTLIINSKVCNSNGIPIQTAYPITFDPSTANNVDDNDDWLITSSVNLKTVKPDVGTVIKNSLGITLTSFGYKFTKAGTYTVTFIATNSKADNQNQVVRQLQLTIVP